MSNHTIKVFTVFNPDGTVNLQYIHHQEDHPTEDSPGQPVAFAPGERVRWKSMNNAPILIDFKVGSPFVSGALHLPIKRPKAVTEWQVVKDDVPTDDGDNPDYQYTVTVLGVPPDDPDLIVDLSGGGGGGGGHRKASPKHRAKPKTKPSPKRPPKTAKKKW